MNNHVLNLFPITSLAALRCSYRLLRITNLNREINSGLYETNVSRIAKNIAFELEQPAALVHRGNDHFVAIPANAPNPNLRQHVVPDVAVLVPEDGAKVLEIANLNTQTLPIALRFLKFYLKSPLMANSELWSWGHNSFFSRRPVNDSDPSRKIDVYGGFVFGLIADSQNQIYLCLDATYKYIDRYFLTEYLKNPGVTVKEHFFNRHCLYQFGDRWYAIQLFSSGKSIEEQEFVIENRETRHVLEYTLEKCRKPYPEFIQSLDPASSSIVYKYPNREMKERYGAAALCRLMYSTNDPKVKALHGFSIKKPQKRFEIISMLVRRYFCKAKLGSVPIQISTEYLREQSKVFSIPDLKFASGNVLHVKRSKDDNGIHPEEFGNARMKHLLTNGIIANTPFDPQYLIVPQIMPKQMATAFKKDFENIMSKLTRINYEMDLVVYPVISIPSIRQQFQRIDDALKARNIRHGFGLLLLPPLAESGNKYLTKLHNFLKHHYHPHLKFQCATIENVMNFYLQVVNAAGQIEYAVREDRAKHFTSYIRYLALGMLQVNRKWLYALQQSLHYDIYISIDVHDRFAGFCFFYKNGENIIFDAQKIPQSQSKHGRAEKLSKKLISKVVYERLKQDIPKYKLDPNAVVILRDGRSYPEEKLALDIVMTKLRSENVINSGKHISSGVVDLHKHSSVPIRIVTESDDSNFLQNPQIGSYRVLRNGEGVVCNTGLPFKFNGTSKTLSVSIASGDLNIEWILEDIFVQSLLAFSAPNKCSFTPLPIKLVDDLLEPLASPVDEEEGILGNDDEFAEEFEFTEEDV